jgi:general secretion pathway protein B
MSYILDALRRADAEREQGAVPSLHSKQVAPALADADEGEARGGVPLIGWIAMAGSALVGAVLVWFFVGRSDAPEPMPPPVASVQPAPAMPAPAPVTTTAQPEMAPPMPVPVPSPAPARAQTLPPPAAPAPAPVQRAIEPRTTTTTPAKPAAKASTPAVDENVVVPSMAELPDDIRRQLPQLTVSGATYSKTASSRMLILNGQIFHEGDKVANDLVLEHIRLKSAVLSFRGTRYSISY